MTTNTVLSDNYILLPSGTTAERPATPTNGMIRYNTTLGYVEGYDNGTWANVLRGGIGDLAVKEGPTSLSAGYTNVWNWGYHNGSSLDATTSSTGIIVNTTGTYYVMGYQRISNVNTWAALAIDGNRGTMDASQGAGASYNNYWGHDHSNGNANWTLSYYCGVLTAGQKVTHGSSGSTSGLTYSIQGHDGGIQIWRIK